MIRSKPSSSMQKTYDDCYLICSTAIYFEGQNNEAEALRSWRNALDQIQYLKLYKLPSNYKPKTETEVALQESLHELELQCKERVDLLEALKQSRADLHVKDGPRSDNPNEQSQATTRFPLREHDLTEGSRLFADRIIPSSRHNDVPPPLPKRPPLPPQIGSDTTEKPTKSTSRHREKSKPSSNTKSKSSSRSQQKYTSRSPSPEKRGLLRTLRPSSKDKPIKDPYPKLQTSLRSKPPAAAKAATQAWGSLSRPSTVPNNSTSSTHNIEPLTDGGVAGSYRGRGPLERGAVDSESLDQRGESSTPNQPGLGIKPPLSVPGTADPNEDRLQRVPIPNYSSTSLPYRKEYSDKGLSRKAIGLNVQDPSLRLDPGKPNSSGKIGESLKGNFSSKPDSLSQGIPEQSGSQTLSNIQDSSRSKSYTEAITSTQKQHEAIEENVNSTDDSWQKKTSHILKDLPKGIDETAAKQILNEIVIQGDEVHWDDVAGLDIAKSALKETVVYPFLRPDLFMGLREPARGMLLFGPPGTGKTMLARAVATESKSTFFAISASSLTSKFLGESEKLVRALFALAKKLAPSIIFVDEIDSLLSSRSSSGEHEATRRIKTEFLIQWSDLARAAAGKEPRERGDASRVLVLAATNLPWEIDEAARRRFVRRQYIPLPESHVRRSQLGKLLNHQKHELAASDIDELINLTNGFSGSDITALAKDAAMGPLRSLGEKLLDMTMDEIRPIGIGDFRASLLTIRPSVSKDGLKEFESWATQYGERAG